MCKLGVDFTCRISKVDKSLFPHTRGKDYSIIVHEDCLFISVPEFPLIFLDVSFNFSVSTLVPVKTRKLFSLSSVANTFPSSGQNQPKKIWKGKQTCVFEIGRRNIFGDPKSI